VAVENVPAPLVEPGHVLVEVAYSLISTGTELSSVQSSGQSLVKKALEQPQRITKLWDYLRKQGIQKTVAKVRGQTDQANPTGYSCAGVVIQVGEGVTDIQPGDRVACAGAGIANHAEIVLAPRNLVVKVPEGCDLKSAASVTLGAIAMQGVRRTDPRLGEMVAVIGLGLLGQISVQLIKAAGCRVIGLDLDGRRVALAKQLGADVALNPAEVDVNNEIRHLTGDHGVDATIITAASSSDAIVQQAMEITCKKGRVVVVGDVGLGLKRSPFYEKEIDFLISCSYGPGRYDERYEAQGLDYPYAYVRWTENRNMAEYLRLVAGGKVQVTPILEREYDVAEAPQAYEELQSGVDKPLGAILRYPLSSQQTQIKKLTTKVVLQSRPLSGTINIVVVGAGNFAKSMHLPNLQKLSNLYHIRAIVSATGSNAKATAQQFGADYATTKYEDVLNDPDVDAVLICTRHHLHAQQTISALRAGKHVYCEKPLALSEQELNDILACYDLSLTNFDKDNLPPNLCNLHPVLMVGFNRRFSPAALHMKEIVSQRELPLMGLYRVNAGYLPINHWVHGPEGGGRLLGEACHMIDLFQFFVDARVTEISVQALRAHSEYLPSGDNVSVILRYADGSVCTLIYVGLNDSPLGKEYVELHTHGKILVLNDFRDLQMLTRGSKKNIWSRTQDKGHQSALQLFGNSICSGNQWPTPLSDLYEVSRVCLNIAEAVAKS
jgi:predicted dehydrogenase/threonine dehydrogenase-like Zn-dependent dehydrogenase